MNTIYSLRLLGLCAVLAAAAACDDDKTDDTVSVPSTSLRVQEIIVSPRAAVPGDTVTLTAIVTSSSQNEGDIPSTQWSADGGTFVQDDRSTVRWVAPVTTGIYSLSVRVTNAAGSTTGRVDVFVGTQTILVPDMAGAIRLMPNGTDFFYQRSPNLETGREVYSYTGVVSDAVPAAGPTGLDIVYAPTLAFEAHATRVAHPDSSGSVSGITLVLHHIYAGDLVTGTLQRISVDLSPEGSQRRNQFRFPNVSPDGDLIAYQGLVTNPTIASSDSVDIFVYRRSGPARVRATLTHPNHENFFPQFSTDQGWLTFISDRSGSGQWDVYGMPVSGTTVDTAPASVRRLTDTGGTIAATQASGFPASPLRAWNPVSPTLAIVSAEPVLYLMTTNAGGATLVDVTGVPLSIQGLFWSPDGSQLAVTATASVDEKTVAQIYTVAGTSGELRYQAAPGDLLADVAWSPDLQWMVFRVTRGSASWLEIIDLGGGSLTGPVALTKNAPAGEASAYRAVMSLSPAWAAGNILYAPMFFSGSATPRIISIDLSNIVR